MAKNYRPITVRPEEAALFKTACLRGSRDGHEGPSRGNGVWREGSGCWTEEHYVRGLYRTVREGNPLAFALLLWTRRAPPAARQHCVRALGAPNHIWRRPWFETLTFFS